jgi:hypothetical protein
MGPICFKFPIKDPGAGNVPIGIEKPDWMKQCNDFGMAHFVGREQVSVNGEKVWADHWSCRLDYKAANQSITFQNWHSIGLGSVAKGLPIRVTGGNSAPNPTRGSPRLNTVWYHDFAVGPSAVKPSDFDAPNFGGKLCIPVGQSDVEAFFGHTVSYSHAFSADFHRRAHFLPLARASKHDLFRARRPKPGRAFTGSAFNDAMEKLNSYLRGLRGLSTKECRDFSQPSLHDMQRLLFDARANELNHIYRDANDTRLLAHSSLEELMTEQKRIKSMTVERPELARKLQDGICHELVMWYIHHLSADAREAVKDRLVLPLLPEIEHAPPHVNAHETHHEAHRRYKAQVSCAICHVSLSEDTVVV